MVLTTQPHISSLSPVNPLHLVLNTMSYGNPYSQWNVANSEATPLLGVLPSSAPLIERPISFTFALNPDILNCVVAGPNGLPYYRVVTNSHLPGYTVIQDRHGKTIGLAEWQANPFVEVRSAVSKRKTGAWLPLSRDGWYVSLLAWNISI